MQYRFPRAIALGLAMSMASPAFAATITSTLRGTSGAALPGALITLTTQDGTQVADATTDTAGRATFNAIAAGNYVVAATGTGIAEVRKPVQVAQQDSVNVDLVAVTTQSLGTVNITATRLKEARIALSPRSARRSIASTSNSSTTCRRAPTRRSTTCCCIFPVSRRTRKRPDRCTFATSTPTYSSGSTACNCPRASPDSASRSTRVSPDKIDFLTGALPAQYGLRTAGVVEVETKDGQFQSGGKIGVFGGGYDTIQPGVEFSGAKDAFSYYVTGTLSQRLAGHREPHPRPRRDPRPHPAGQGIRLLCATPPTHRRASR